MLSQAGGISSWCEGARKSRSRPGPATPLRTLSKQSDFCRISYWTSLRGPVYRGRLSRLGAGNLEDVEAEVAYDLMDFRVPSLGGLGLRTFANLVETGPGRDLLLPSLLRTFGAERFRRLEIEDHPSPVPEFALPNGHASEVDEGDLATFLASSWWQRLNQEAAYPGVLAYSEAYREGATSPVQVAENVLDAIRDSSSGPEAIRAVIQHDEAEVMRQAGASAERWAAGRPLSVLDGVPVAIKDELDLTPFPTMVGTSFLGDRPAREDAHAVARLRAAGALLIGKTNMHEIGIGVTGVNAYHGVVRNPYDASRISGGSSSGSAAAVAAGLCPVSLGADGGGSVRIPAALCGVVGLKPTFGRVSEFGAFPLCWSMGHIGPIGQWARDVALAYGLIAGPDKRDPWSLGHPAPRLPAGDPERALHLRIGVYPSWFEHADPTVVRTCRAMLTRFEERGATVVEVEIPELDAVRFAHVVTIFVEMAASLHGVYRRRQRAFGLDTRVNLAIARMFTGADYVQAQRVRTRAVKHFMAALDKVDVIATPATPVPAPRIPERDLPEGRSDLSTTSALMRFMFAGNLTGLPAITFPAGYDEHGLPIGLQLMGRPWQEDVLLQCAVAADDMVPRRPPTRRYDLLGQPDS